MRLSTPTIKGRSAIISIHAPLAGCDDLIFGRAAGRNGISIHAPLAGCDLERRPRLFPAADFNPRTPCGVRLNCAPIPSSESEFQSTHPLRGATPISCSPCFASSISIHAPLAGCDPRQHRIRKAAPISIHAPLAGCDCIDRLNGICRIISIHAPLAGCDFDCKFVLPHFYHFNPRTPCGVRPLDRLRKKVFTDFNPRTPCGVRPPTKGVQSYIVAFQSTHPLRGATSEVLCVILCFVISIHAPLAGCDIRSGK